jgi:hypothetical protein
MVDGAATLFVGKEGGIALDRWPVARADGPALGQAVQGEWLNLSGDRDGGPARIAAVGRLGQRWLLVGQGPRRALSAVFAELGAELGLAFPAEGVGPAIIVRTPQGLTDLTGRVVNELDPSPARLQLVAAPRPLGAVGLARMLDSEQPTDQPNAVRN